LCQERFLTHKSIVFDEDAEGRIVASGPHKTLIVGTGQREHRDLQSGGAHADMFSLSHSDLEYSGTAVFAKNRLWQVKTELWVSAVFATFSMTYDRRRFKFEYLGLFA
jgi:hypothetical protein